MSGVASMNGAEPILIGERSIDATDTLTVLKLPFGLAMIDYVVSAWVCPLVRQLCYDFSKAIRDRIAH